MCALSSGGRIVSKQTSELQVTPLESSAVIGALTSLRDVFLVSLGPHACGSLVHNDIGGHVSLTSSSTRIQSGVRTDESVVKLLISALCDHRQTYSDGGSLVAALSLQLVLNALSLSVHRRLVVEIYDVLVRESVTYLSSESCPCKTSLDVTDTDQILRLVRSLYTSRSTCLLYDTDLAHMCQLSSTTFLNTFASRTDRLQDDYCLLYVMSAGRDVQHSEILEGILYPTPQIPTYRATRLSLQTTLTGLVSVALVEASMAGDSDSYLDVTYHTEVQLSDATLHQLLEFSEVVCRAGVGLVVCQRVIHPTVKQRLQHQGVFCLDRLGSVHFRALHKLAGGRVLDPFAPGEICLESVLKSVEHVVSEGKSYLRLFGAENHSHPVYTVSLCHRSQEALTELKDLFESIQHVLTTMMTQPKVLAGATCWQTCVLENLQTQKDRLAEQCVSLGCTKTQFMQVLQSYTAAMATVVRATGTGGLVCHKTGHHFMVGKQDKADTSTCSCHDPNGPCQSFDTSVTCGCGAVTRRYSTDFVDLDDMTLNKSTQRIQHQSKFDIGSQPLIIDWSKCRVFDAFSSMLGSLKSAVAISCMILGIHNYVKDVN